MQDAQKDIASLLPEELAAALREMGEAPFRAKQVGDWLNKGVWDFGEMKNIPGALRTRLAEAYYLSAPQVLRKQVSLADGKQAAGSGAGLLAGGTGTAGVFTSEAGDMKPIFPPIHTAIQSVPFTSAPRTVNCGGK